MNYNNSIGYKDKNFGIVKYYVITLCHQLFFSVLIVMAVILMTTSHKNKEFDIYVRENIINITRPAVQIIEFPVNIFARIVLEIRDFVFAKRDNKILKKQNINLEKLYKQSLNIENENKSLKQILNFVDKSSFYNFKTAKIYYTSRNSIIDKIIIKAGLKDNIIENSLVLGDKGSVVGRVVNIGKNLSDILLLTDINSKIPVVILGKERTKGILVGDNSLEPKILYLNKNHSIKKGDLVYTSGDNKLIISGLFIGKVKKSKPKEIKVELYQNIKETDDVLIVDVDQNITNTDTNQEEQTKDLTLSN